MVCLICLMFLITESKELFACVNCFPQIVLDLIKGQQFHCQVQNNTFKVLTDLLTMWTNTILCLLIMKSFEN